MPKNWNAQLVSPKRNVARGKAPDSRKPRRKTIWEKKRQIRRNGTGMRRAERDWAASFLVAIGGLFHLRGFFREIAPALEFHCGNRVRGGPNRQKREFPSNENRLYNSSTAANQPN